MVRLSLGRHERRSFRFGCLQLACGPRLVLGNVKGLRLQKCHQPALAFYSHQCSVHRLLAPDQQGANDGTNLHNRRVLSKGCCLRSEAASQMTSRANCTTHEPRANRTTLTPLRTACLHAHHVTPCNMHRVTPCTTSHHAPRHASDFRLTVFSPDSRLLEPSEWCSRVHHLVRIDPSSSRLQHRSHHRGSIGVIAPDGACVHVAACVCAIMCACVRACVRACVER